MHVFARLLAPTIQVLARRILQQDGKIWKVYANGGAKRPRGGIRQFDAFQNTFIVFVLCFFGMTTVLKAF